jgi:hypothetical protein
MPTENGARRREGGPMTEANRPGVVQVISATKEKGAGAMGRRPRADA